MVAGVRLIKTAVLTVVAGTCLAGCPSFAPTEVPAVEFVTSQGTFVADLNADAAPVTVAGFRQYVEGGAYDGTIVHRIAGGAFISGGRYDIDLNEIGSAASLPNEAPTGLEPVAATIALVPIGDGTSVDQQFVVNLAYNPQFAAGPLQAGYPVFAQVVEGLDVVAAIAAMETIQFETFSSLPAEPVTVEQVTLIQRPVDRFLDGPAYADWVGYRGSVLFRDLLVDTLAFFITPG